MSRSRGIEAPQPPSYLGLAREALGLLELPRLLWNAPGLAAQPRGGGETVLVFPGYGAGDGSTWTLRRYLRRLGYDARTWGIGRNDGDVESLIPRATQCARRAAERTGAPVRLIGWSLGGYLAREAARELPSAVAQVITLGSPVVGGPKYTTVAELYRRQGFDLDAIEAAVAERNRIPLRVPVTAIYSRSDGVVAWRACIDESSLRVDHREVRSTHVGLGFSAEVYRIVARALADLTTER